MEGRRYKLWLAGKVEAVGGVGVMVKDKLCEKMVEIRRISDRVMAFAEADLSLCTAKLKKLGRIMVFLMS